VTGYTIGWHNSVMWCGDGWAGGIWYQYGQQQSGTLCHRPQHQQPQHQLASLLTVNRGRH